MNPDARPVVGITTRAALAPDGSLHPNVAPYVRAVQRAGGAARVVPNDPSSVERVLHECDALLLSGGGDVDPARYGADRHAATGAPNTERDAFEIALVRAARERATPVLCICRGMQVANVALGGTLVQHLPDRLGAEGKIGHSQVEVYALNREQYAPGHIVRLRPQSALARLLGATEFPTNAMHHQAVDVVAPDLVVAGGTDDGVIEALDAAFTHPFFVAVQWHPEALPASDPIGARLFAGLVGAARGELVK